MKQGPYRGRTHYLPYVSTAEVAVDAAEAELIRAVQMGAEADNHLSIDAAVALSGITADLRRRGIDPATLKPVDREAVLDLLEGLQIRLIAARSSVKRGRLMHKISYYREWLADLGE